MTETNRVLLVANRTAKTPALREQVRKRAEAGPATFHLVVPRAPSGLHRVVDPEVAGVEAAQSRLDEVLQVLGEVAGDAPVRARSATPTPWPRSRTP